VDGSGYRLNRRRIVDNSALLSALGAAMRITFETDNTVWIDWKDCP